MKQFLAIFVIYFAISHLQVHALPPYNNHKAASTVPGQVLTLANWYLTLPTGQPGNPTLVYQPSLNTYDDKNFFVDTVGGSNVVSFVAPTTGVTTKDSTYPRCELREMSGSSLANWSNTEGYHRMEVHEAFIHLPEHKPEVVGGQIHNSSSDIIEVKLENSTLFVSNSDGKSIGNLDSSYKLGTFYNLTVVATDNKIFVYYNGAQKISYDFSGSGWYFKAGCYTQSNPSHGDGDGQYGQVDISYVNVLHTK